MYWIYSTVLALGLLLTLPYWLVQGLLHGKYRAGLGERLGQVPARLRGSQAPAIWVHAVSVGEVLAVAGLVERLRQQLPQHRIVVSTTTDTGQKVARARFGEDSVFYFPLDFGFAVRPYLRAIRPALIVIAETEFWPNFLRLAHAHGTRLAVVNARISDRSWPGYRRWRFFLSRVVRPVDIFLAQTARDRDRLVEIGAPADRVQVTGNLKFDVAATPSLPIVDSLRASFQQAGAGPVFVCGSTVEGEETILLRAFQTVLSRHAQAVMLLAPRHPERFAEVAKLVEKSGVRFWQRSQWAGEGVAGGVLLLDSIGELSALYALGDVAFVGGSLVPRGGHNILEPAQQGVAIVVGRHTENFRDIVESFQSRGALRVVEPSEVAQTFMELGSDPAARQQLSLRATEALSIQTGATQRTVDAVTQLLELPLAIRQGEGIRATPQP